MILVLALRATAEGGVVAGSGEGGDGVADDAAEFAVEFATCGW
jgi:hypothetical protein